MLLWQKWAGREKKSLNDTRDKETLIDRQKREKGANKERIYELLETSTPLTNEQVRTMLGIPESTITRYFEELEKEGKVRQVGITGRSVSYERTKKS